MRLAPGTAQRQDRASVSIHLQRFRAGCAALAVLLSLSGGCASRGTGARPASFDLVEIARSERQWTGVAVGHDGRIFVTFPRWSEFVPFSLGEVLPSGEVRPYPDRTWNSWTPAQPPGERFVCAQSAVVDARGLLWILDAANPRFQGVVPGGAKLVEIDPASGRVVAVFRFNEVVAPRASYLNDVRIDVAHQHAYLTDSGLGALVVLDLASGRARRVLTDHPATKAQATDVIVGGKPWRLPDGSAPRVHADGIALDKHSAYLYFQSLVGRTLYRIATRRLRDPEADEAALARAVERVAWAPASDGLEFGPDGSLYFTALEFGGIRRRSPAGFYDTVARDPRIIWPDSLAVGPDGSLFFTTSQVHLGAARTEPYRLFRLVPRD